MSYNCGAVLPSPVVNGKRSASVEGCLVSDQSQNHSAVNETKRNRFPDLVVAGVVIALLVTWTLRSVNQNPNSGPASQTVFGAPVPKHVLLVGGSNANVQIPRATLSRPVKNTGLDDQPQSAQRDPRLSSDLPAESDTTGKSPVRLKMTASLTRIGSQPVEHNDKRLRQLIVGSWEQELYGLRKLTVRRNGTATMTVKPDGVWQYLFGERLQLDFKWSIEGRALSFKATGGQPKGKIELVMKMYGSDRCQQILDLTADRLLLEPDEGDSEHDWKRLSSEDG